MDNLTVDNQSELIFYSEKMFLSEKLLNQNQLKLTYQKQLLSNLELKHKEWSKKFSSKP